MYDRHRGAVVWADTVLNVAGTLALLVWHCKITSAYRRQPLPVADISTKKAAGKILLTCLFVV